MILIMLILQIILVGLVKGDSDYSLTDVAYTKLYDLHCAGEARFFYIEGEDKGFSFEWEKEK